jgi:hypothetical protein
MHRDLEVVVVVLGIWRVPAERAHLLVKKKMQ